MSENTQSLEDQIKTLKAEISRLKTALAYSNDKVVRMRDIIGTIPLNIPNEMIDNPHPQTFYVAGREARVALAIAEYPNDKQLPAHIEDDTRKQLQETRIKKA